MSDMAGMVREWGRRWTAHDVDGLLALFTQDGLYEDTALEHRSTGTEKLREFFEQTFVAFPDFVVEVHNAVGNADMAAGEWTMSGTHLGTFPGQPATGKPFRVSGSCVMKFENCLIRPHRDYWSLVAFNRQVGLPTV